MIDQQVYGSIKDKDCLKIPYNTDQKIDLYFDYLERLTNICLDYNIPFSKADRIVYQLDKIHNKDIRLKKST